MKEYKAHLKDKLKESKIVFRMVVENQSSILLALQVQVSSSHERRVRLLISSNALGIGGLSRIT